MIRYINLLSILLLLELFGLLPRTSSPFLRGDIFILVTFSYIIVKEKNLRFYLLSKNYFNFLLILYLVSFYCIFTLLKGGINFLDIIKSLRTFLPIILIFNVYYDSTKHNTTKFYYKIIIFSASIVTIILFLIAILKVDWFQNFPRIGYGYQRGEYDFGIQRVYMYSSFVLPVFAFLLKFIEYIYKRTNLYWVVFFFGGVLLQGFRVYIIATVFVVIYFLIRLSKIRIKLNLKFLIIIFILFLPLLSSGLSERILSGFNDVIFQRGTFYSRLINDSFRLDLFKNHFLFGIGLVHNDSEKARELGASTSFELSTINDNIDKNFMISMYSIRSTDSGYLDLLVQFGLVGTIIFLFLILYDSWLKYKLWKSSNYNYSTSLQNIALVWVLLIVLITHSPLLNEYGLVPLVLSVGIIDE